MPLCISLLFTNPFLATLWLGRPGSRVARLGICKFVDNKQMGFLFYSGMTTIIVLFLKHLDTVANVTDCDYGKINF